MASVKQAWLKNKVTVAEVPSVHVLTDLGQKRTFMGEDAHLGAKYLPRFKKQEGSTNWQTGAKEEGQGALASASILFSDSL